jgi:hypothetical protein
MATSTPSGDTLGRGCPFGYSEISGAAFGRHLVLARIAINRDDSRGLRNRCSLGCRQTDATKTYDRDSFTRQNLGCVPHSSGTSKDSATQDAGDVEGYGLVDLDCLVLLHNGVLRKCRGVCKSVRRFARDVKRLLEPA